jgi:hypothetical protein
MFSESNQQKKVTTGFYFILIIFCFAEDQTWGFMQVL